MPPQPKLPLAFQRAPSKLTPEAGGVEPIAYNRLVKKPVFDRKCVSCHQTKGQGPDFSYGSMTDYAFYWPSNVGAYVNGDITAAVHGGSRTLPGSFGAKYARLTPTLLPGHYGVSLTPEEKRRVTLWLDCNSNEFGAYTSLDKQQQGQLVWPELDVDSLNPTGVESDRPLPGSSDIRRALGNWVTSGAVPEVQITTRGSRLTVENPRGSWTAVSVYDIAGRQVSATGARQSSRVTTDFTTQAPSTRMVRVRTNTGQYASRVIMLNH